VCPHPEVDGKIVFIFFSYSLGFAPKYGQLMAVARFPSAITKPTGAALHQLNPLEKAPI
jgi:hypothetical protein